jgi:hypothetical protein
MSSSKAVTDIDTMLFGHLFVYACDHVIRKDRIRQKIIISKKLHRIKKLLKTTTKRRPVIPVKLEPPTTQ